jgi:hypothetical protein
MKLRNLIASLALMLSVALGSAQAGTIIVDENFDSYADTAAMTAVWGGGVGTLDTAFAFSGTNSALHAGGAVNLRTDIGSVTPSTTEDLVLRGRIYDGGDVDGERLTIGLRTGAAPLFEMGHYIDGTLGIPAGSPYAIRALSMGNGITPSPNWKPFLIGGNSISKTQGWHTYEATFSIASGLTVTLDLGSDGSIDSTLHFAGDGVTPFNNFTDLRFGGPSNSSSTSPANFDDIRLSLGNVIPEPASLALVGLMGIGLGCLRTRK